MSKSLDGGNYYWVKFKGRDDWTVAFAGTDCWYYNHRWWPEHGSGGGLPVKEVGAKIPNPDGGFNADCPYKVKS